jgi:hypothetical protein
MTFHFFGYTTIGAKNHVIIVEHDQLLYRTMLSSGSLDYAKDLSPQSKRLVKER